MQFSGLSSDQAPVIDAPFRFFISAPLFVVFASIALFFMDVEEFLSLYTPATIAWVHFISLGFFTMIMMGTITQMLPVLAGVSLPKAKLLASSTHMLLSTGSIFFVLGMYRSSNVLLLTAGIFLIISFFLLFGFALVKLIKVPSLNATVKSMRIAMIMGLITAVLGFVLILGKMGLHSIDPYTLLLTHSAVAIFGFASVLIIGVSFQVMPMFYVTTGFKKFCKRYVVPLMVLGIVLWSLSVLFFFELRYIGFVIIMTFLLAFSVASIKKIRHRRRPVFDVSLFYWYMALGSIYIATLIAVVMMISPLALEYYFALSIGVFLMAILSGMLLKIVPFLVWFHLNAKGYMQIPTIRDIISERYMKIQAGLFVVSMISFIFIPHVSWMIKVSAVLLLGTFLLLFLLIVEAIKVYRYWIKQKPDFDMNFGKI